MKNFKEMYEQKKGDFDLEKIKEEISRELLKNCFETESGGYFVLTTCPGVSFGIVLNNSDVEIQMDSKDKYGNWKLGEDEFKTDYASYTDLEELYKKIEKCFESILRSCEFFG